MLPIINGKFKSFLVNSFFLNRSSLYFSSCRPVNEADLAVSAVFFI